MYTIEKHSHNFAVWAAARASQRGLTTTKNIKKAIDKAGLRGFVQNNLKIEMSQSDFDVKHVKLCNEIDKNLKENKVAKSTFGRAAKIVAIYLKVQVLLLYGEKRTISNVIHPPIDRILLENINKEYKKQKGKKLFKELPTWTTLTVEEYKDVWGELKKLDYKENWKIEEYWNV